MTQWSLAATHLYPTHVFKQKQNKVQPNGHKGLLCPLISLPNTWNKPCHFWAGPKTPLPAPHVLPAGLRGPVSTGPPRAGCRLTFLPRVPARPLLLSSHRCCNSSFRTIFPNPSSQQLQATLLGWDPLFTFLAREIEFQHCASIVCHPPSSLYVGGICLSEVGVVWRAKQQKKTHPHCCLFFFFWTAQNTSPREQQLCPRKAGWPEI